MRQFYLGGVFMGAALAALAIAPGAPTLAPVTMEAGDLKPARQRRSASASTPARYRSRRAQAKPRRRSNRIHVSRRVRRKHRRAA